MVTRYGSAYGDSIGSLAYNGMNRDQLRRYVRRLHAALWRWEQGASRLWEAMTEDDAAEAETAVSQAERILRQRYGHQA